MTTIARLSFWIPPEGEAAFRPVFRLRIQPLLKKHGLRHPGTPPGDRPEVDGITHHLFAVESPARIAAIAQALRHDPD